MKITTKCFLVIVLALFPLTMVSSISATNGSTYEFVLKWGEPGTGDGQFNGLYGVAVDSNDNVYVADSLNNRVQKFNSTGGFILKWGTGGNGTGQFGTPWCLAVDSNDNVYVADSWNHRIQKFNSTGGFVTEWGTLGTGDGQFDRPFGVAVDSDDNVYVTDFYNNRVQKFNSTGGFILKWGTPGTGDGQFNRTRGITIDSSDNVYVGDYNNYRVQKFNSTGDFILKWGIFGTGDGQFNRTQGLCVDLNDDVFVADFDSHRVQKFNSTGGFILEWGTLGTGDGQFNGTAGVGADLNGNIYVTDFYNNRIQKFRPPDTTAPTITVISPQNNTKYATSTIPLNYTVNENVSWTGLSLDDQANVTITGNTTLVGLLDGLHSVVVYANDTVGNMGASSMVYFTVDTASPVISIVSPENMTYTVADVPLDFTVSESTSWIGYSLDGQANNTVVGNTTLVGLLDGSHSVVVYANDTVGNMGVSSMVYFTVDTTPPNITDVSQTPAEDNVLPTDEVEVNATVTDDISGVKQVILNYTNGNGTWITTGMTNLEGNIWNATIPAFPYCTNVTYVIMAEDNANNTITTEEVFGYEYQYHVVPEFPSLIILPLFMIATFLAIIVYKRKHATLH
jgi:streptogramin lyase